MNSFHPLISCVSIALTKQLSHNRTDIRADNVFIQAYRTILAILIKVIAVGFQYRQTISNISAQFELFNI